MLYKSFPPSSYISKDITHAWVTEILCHININSDLLLACVTTLRKIPTPWGNIFMWQLVGVSRWHYFWMKFTEEEGQLYCLPTDQNQFTI